MNDPLANLLDLIERDPKIAQNNPPPNGTVPESCRKWAAAYRSAIEDLPGFNRLWVGIYPRVDSDIGNGLDFHVSHGPDMPAPLPEKILRKVFSDQIIWERGQRICPGDHLTQWLIGDTHSQIFLSLRVRRAGLVPHQVQADALFLRHPALHWRVTQVRAAAWHGPLHLFPAWQDHLLDFLREPGARGPVIPSNLRKRYPLFFPNAEN